MFKALKKLFSKVEKDTEAALGSQIEQELAKEREKARAATPPAPTPTPMPAAKPTQPAPAAPIPPAQTKPAPAPTTAPAPSMPAPTPPPTVERPSAPVAPTPAPASPPEPPKAPSGYKEAKRLGAIEDATRKKETIEERLTRELTQAVEQQKEIETVVGKESDRIMLPADKLEDLLWELELGLLEADVALPVIEAVKSSVREQLSSIGVSRRDPSGSVEEVLRTAIRKVLSGGQVSFDAFVQRKMKEKKPVVIMFVGVNGTGKTTSIAKIAHRLSGQKISCVMAAGDTFRAGAIEQLTLHADRIGVKIIKHSAGADPAAVAYDAIEHAKSRNKDVVLLDTAGRMQTNTNLMEEMAKIRRVAKPDLTVFVGDSLAGNDAVEQAREFNKVVGIDGVILTKVDADAKGGAALSVAYTIGKPLLFIGVGQGYDDQIPFDPNWMVDRLFAKGEEAEAPAA
jgi:fused signal recognition particle receptor